MIGFQILGLLMMFVGGIAALATDSAVRQIVAITAFSAGSLLLALLYLSQKLFERLAEILQTLQTIEINISHLKDVAAPGEASNRIEQ